MTELWRLPATARIDLAEEPEFELGRLRVYPAECSVEMDGQRRELQPRVMQVLVALAKGRSSVLSRDRLIELCWNGRVVGDDALNRCVVSLRQLAHEFDEPFSIETIPRVGYALREASVEPSRTTLKLTWPIFAGVALLAMATAGLLTWTLISRSSSAPVVAIAAADTSPADQALARDLLVNLGALQTDEPDAMDLVSIDDGSKKPTLIFQVGRSGHGLGAEANLALRDAGDRSVLWAKEFRDPNNNEADLRQQLAYSAAHVLHCAVEARDPTARRLSRRAVKTYLNACAPNPNADLGDFTAAISSLRQLVVEAPDFAGGWAKLIFAETEALGFLAGSELQARRTQLARHIVQARKLHPYLAETYIGDVALTAEHDFLRRGRLLDEAIEHNPDSPGLRATRAVLLSNVGRVEDALRDARRARDLDPLSPQFREGHIIALAFAGRMDEALAEFDKAERLWPGATGLRLVLFTVHLRVGDPREAMRLLHSGVLQHDSSRWIRLLEVFLRARIDRSPATVATAIREATIAYNQSAGAIHALSQTLVEFDREEELFRILLNWRRMDIVTSVTSSLFRPAFSEFQKDLRFMQVAKRLGLLDYWQASGHWPDFCFDPDLPYDCKAESAKISAAT